MPYAAPFHRLVMIGNLYADTFNCTMSFAPTGGSSIPAVGPTLLAGVAAAVGAWWDNPLAADPGNGLTLSGAALLTSVKLNRIGTDGKYEDVDTFEHIYPSPIPGGDSATGVPQLTLVSTLRGPADRELAGRGRIYWPPSIATRTATDTTGRVVAATALQYAHGVASLIRSLNAAYDTAGVDAVAAIASASGAGRFQVVTKVTVGRVIDTMRSRRNKQIEDPSEAPV